ncbi:MAG: DNA alkylation repair protein [Clostridia bacterium]|nr:DNA alkylation repair protein [Clostridia bacterium]
MEEIREKLLELQDKKYQKFHSKLCPNVEDIIGVRVPELRKIAKQIAKENPQEYLEKAPKEYYEERMLQGFVIGYMKASLGERLTYLDEFVPIIDNWAVCDCCTSTYKFTKKYLKEMWSYIQKYLSSNREFELRFGIIMLMDYYLTEEYIDQVLEIYDNIQNEGYYVKMGVAWAISMAYMKFPEKTMELLNNNHLDDFTYNKALQKMIESYQIDKETKQKLKGMKRR